MKYAPEELKIINTIGPWLEEGDYQKALNYIISAGILSYNQKRKLILCIAYVTYGSDNWVIEWVWVNKIDRTGFYYLRPPKTKVNLFQSKTEYVLKGPTLGEGSRALAQIGLWDEIGFTPEEDGEMAAEILQNAIWGGES